MNSGVITAVPSRAPEICEQVLVRLALSRSAFTPSACARELLLLELARHRNNLRVDPAEDVQSAFWMLVPPMDR